MKNNKDSISNIIKPFLDLNLLIIVATIILFGFLVLTSASIELSAQKYSYPFYYINKQIVHFLFSILVGSFFIFYISTEDLKKYYKFFFYISFLLLIIVYFFGETRGGSTRWLSYNQFNIQPSEIFKLFYIVWLCAYLDYNKNNIKLISFFLKPILFFLLAGYFLYSQPDLGSIIVIFLITIIMLFIGNARKDYILSLFVLGFFLLSLLIYLKPYMLSRFYILEPCKRYFDIGYQSGYHLCHSLMAIGSGGIFGKGIGLSTSKLFYLPAAHTDFIFAVLAEELGIFGIIFLVILFYLFIMKCFSIAEKALRVDLVFQAYLAYAIGIFITLQSFFNIAVNLGLAPTKGLPLPLFSYGGSNYLVSILSILIIFRIYRDVYKKTLNTSKRYY